MICKNLLALVVAALLTIAVGPLRSGAQSDSNAATLAGGAALFAELDTSLDSKKMKAGDTVTAHLIEALKLQGKTILPGGTKLLGHVIQTSARSKGDQDSVLAIQFDKAETKGKEAISVGLVIRAMAAAPRGSFDNSSPGQDPMGEGRIGTTTSPMGGSRTSAPSPETAGARGTRGEADADSGLGANGKLTQTSRGVYGIDGLRLAVDASKAAPVSILISTGKNVHVDAGAKILFFTQAAESAN